MTLKEQLSFSRRIAIAQTIAQSQVQSDMRQIMSKYILNLISLMHKHDPVAQVLPVQVEFVRSERVLKFTPCIDIGDDFIPFYHSTDRLNSILDAYFPKEFLTAAKEFDDIDVTPTDSEHIYTFSMTLDD